MALSNNTTSIDSFSMPYQDSASMLCLYYIYRRLADNASVPTADRSDIWKRLSFWIGGVMVTLIVFGGTACNALALVLMNCCSARRRLKVSQWLHYQTACDITLLVSGWFLTTIPILRHKGELRHTGLMVPAYPFLVVISNATLTNCVWSTVLVTLERYLAVSGNMYQYIFKSYWNNVVLMISASLFTLGFNSIRYFEVTIKHCYSEVDDVSFQVVEPTPLVNNRLYVLLYRQVGDAVLMTLLPFLITTVLTISIVCRLEQVKRRRSTRLRCQSLPVNIPTQTIDRSRKDTLLNQMMMTVLGKFLFCYSMPTIGNILYFNIEQWTDTTINIVRCMVLMGNCLVMLHSATNSIIYMAYVRRIMRRKVTSKSGTRTTTNNSPKMGFNLEVFRKPTWPYAKAAIHASDPRSPQSDVEPLRSLPRHMSRSKTANPIANRNGSWHSPSVSFAKQPNSQPNHGASGQTSYLAYFSPKSLKRGLIR